MEKRYVTINTRIGTVSFRILYKLLINLKKELLNNYKLNTQLSYINCKYNFF